MKLDSNAWHVKWFHFVQRLIGFDSYSSGTSLCHFIRVTMVWGPLVALFYVGVVGGVVSIFTVLPWLIAGPLGMFAMWGVVAAVGLAIAYSIYLATEYEPTSGGAIDCILSYIKAAKAKVCPLVTFDEDGVHGI